MSNEAHQHLADGITVIDRFFDGVFAPLERWIPALSELLSATARPVTGSALAHLVREGAHEVLDSSDLPLYGAGFCGAPSVVAEGNPLAWWQGPERTLLAASTFGPGQAAIDLARLEWYRIPRERRGRHVAGPFVDYLCSNEVTLTSSMPLIVDGEFWGVACADVLLRSVEECLLPSIRGVERAALVNAHGRVVVTGDPDYETGDRMPGLAAQGGATADGSGREVAMTVVRSDRYPFALAAPEFSPMLP